MSASEMREPQCSAGFNPGLRSAPSRLRLLVIFSAADSNVLTLPVTLKYSIELSHKIFSINETIGAASRSY